MTSTGVLSRARCSRDGCSVATGAYLLTSRARKFEKGETKGCRANIRCTFPACSTKTSGALLAGRLVPNASDERLQSGLASQHLTRLRAQIC